MAMANHGHTDYSWSLHELDIFFIKSVLLKRSNTEVAHCLSTRSTKGVRKLKDNFSSLISVVYLDMESFKEFVTSTQSRGCFMDRPTTLTNDASVKFSEYRTNLPEKCSSFAPLTFELLSAMSIAKTSAFQFHCICEYFYSVIDTAFFCDQTFSNCIRGLGFSCRTLRSRAEWNDVRRLLPAPSLFSTAFIRNELLNLDSFRVYSRGIQYKKTLYNRPLLDNIGICVSRPLRIGDCVAAFHPLTNFIHNAEISAIGFGSYTLTFQHDGLYSVDLPDTEVLGYTPLSSLECTSSLQDIRPVDVIHTSVIIKFLTRKRLLLNYLKQLLLDTEDRRATFIPLLDDIRHKFAWVLFEIERTDMEIESCFLLLHSQVCAGLLSDTATKNRIRKFQQYCWLVSSDVLRRHEQDNPTKDDSLKFLCHCISLFIALRGPPKSGISIHDILATFLNPVSPVFTDNSDAYTELRDVLYSLLYTTE